MPTELVDHRLAEDRTLSGVMKNMQSYQPGVEVAVYHRFSLSKFDIEIRGYRQNVRQVKDQTQLCNSYRFVLEIPCSSGRIRQRLRLTASSRTSGTTRGIRRRTSRSASGRRYVQDSLQSAARRVPDLGPVATNPTSDGIRVLDVNSRLAARCHFSATSQVSLARLMLIIRRRSGQSRHV
jgi:hypothetical protein